MSDSLAGPLVAVMVVVECGGLLSGDTHSCLTLPMFIEAIFRLEKQARSCHL